MPQSIEKLRKKVQVKSEEVELFKRKYIKKALEIESLLGDITRLKDLLHTRDAKITTLEAIIHLSEMKQRASETKKINKIPFIKETEHALFCAEHAVVDAPTNFSDDSMMYPEWDSCTHYESGTLVAFKGKKLYAFEIGVVPSRFMPKVKFCIIGHEQLLVDRKIGFTLFDQHHTRVVASEDGAVCGSCVQTAFEDRKVVSIYEAIPELVPDGMVYDKKSDSLVELPSFQKEVVDAPINFSEVKTGEAIKEEMSDSDVAFSSRFMPNVKFRVPGKFKSFCTPLAYTLPDGSNWRAFCGRDGWNSSDLKEVSIYEADPRLVPDGMVYDKDSESLKPKRMYPLNEVDFQDRDSEAFEAMLSKAASRKKSGIDYSPDDVAFKKSVSPCSTCACLEVCNLFIKNITDGYAIIYPHYTKKS